MSPLPVFILLAILGGAAYWKRLRDEYHSFHLHLHEADLMRAVERVKEQIWTGEREDVINNMIINIHNTYKFHPLCEEYLSKLANEITNYELNELIKKQKKALLN